MPLRCVLPSGRGVLLAVAFLYGGCCTVGASAAQHPLAGSTVAYLPVPADGEWDTLAVSPDGARVLLGDAYRRIAVIDVATDTLAATIELPDDGFIGGIAFSSDGRLFVNTDYAFYELDPRTYAPVATLEAPWAWYRGPMVVTPDGQYIYVASEWDIFVLRVTAAGVEWIDTLPETSDVDGLLPAHPTWEADFLRARRITVSPDGDRLYVVGEEIEFWPSIAGLQVVAGIGAGPTSAGLTFTVFEMPAAVFEPGATRVELSGDGSLLFDSRGNVWDTVTQRTVRSLPFDAYSAFSPEMFVRTPTGAFLFYEGFARSYNDPEQATYGGEGIVVASGVDYQFIDLDDDPRNGLTGIDLPEATGWFGLGSYNNHEMIITPDGRKIYIAAGSSGALAVNLELSTHLGEVVPDRGGNDGEVTVRFLGSFVTGTQVALVSAGGEAISGYDVTLEAGVLQARFDLTGRGVGACDVIFTAPDGARRLDDAFRIEPGRVAAGVDFVGRAQLAAGEDARLKIRVENTGNVDLTDLIVTLALTAGTQYKVELPAAVVGGADQIDTEYTTATAERPEYVWIGRLVPRGFYTFYLVVAGPADRPPPTWDVELETTVGFLESVDSSTAKSATRESAIGDLCTVADALVKNLHTELSRRGYQVQPGQVNEVMGDVMVGTLRDFGAAKLTEMVAKAVGELAVRALIPEAMPLWNVVFGTVSDLKSCYDLLKTLLGFDGLFSFDPNDKVSHTGLDGYLAGPQTIGYTIHFENLPEATAAARTVTITDLLSASFDYSSFELGSSSHRDVLTYELDETTGRLVLTFTGIGLPPNVDPPEGEGWVEFSIRVRDDVPSGTAIRNQASIVFDTNDPIVTPELVHTLDMDAPSSAVVPLAAATTQTEFTVAWSGSDAGVGVWDYTVYVATDRGPYVIWLDRTSAASGDFTGEVGRSYRFYTIARDRLGNVEEAPSPADAVTTIEPREEEPGPSAGGRCGSGTLGMAGLMLCGLFLVRQRTTLRGSRE
ncbi:MAG TPA: hypothetical protein PKK06_03175 [Phycisphaerae bacterium]|nr:hypothetical protein [Phycisphaerae bacterium]HNU44687.1 hypothetical protein [Phycisphaerae bacterium]